MKTCCIALLDIITCIVRKLPSLVVCNVLTFVIIFSDAPATRAL